MSNKITIGCDPEYGLVKDGRLIMPNEAVHDTVGGTFGIDGSGRVAELRPPYASSPAILTKNIKKVLQDGIEVNPGVLTFKMKAGSSVVNEPIGGHIHFGNPSLRKPEVARRLAEALDKTVSILTLMVEDQDEALSRRVGTTYGQPFTGNYRDQAWGMEYRVLPSWLTTPEECEAVLSLSYIVAHEFHDDDIMQEACSLPAYDSLAFRECDKIGLMYWIPHVVDFIKRLPKFDEYESAIRPLFKLIKNQKVWSCDKNMVDTWNLRPAKTQRRVAELV